MHVIGTVRAVETKTRMIEVITGVGYAVRILRLQVAEDCRIMVPGGSAQLSSFTPGTHARVEYVAAPAAAGAGIHGGIHGIVVAITAFDVERSDGAP